jgi:PAS domain S-box-containing protein
MTTAREPESGVKTPNELAWFRTLDLHDEMRLFLDRIRAVVSQIDGDGRIVYVNSSIKTVSGFEPTEMIGRLGREFIHPDDLEVVVELSATEAGELAPEHLYRTLRKGGGWAWVETAFARQVRVADGSLHRVTFSRDVTEMVDAGARIRESEERYRMVVESSSETITESSVDGRVLFGDGKAAEIIGYTAEELHAQDNFARVHEDDVDRVREAFNRAFESGAKEVIAPYRVQHRDGHWRWLTSRSVGYRALEGDMRFLNVTRDVTEEIEQERERREFAHRTEQARRLESLGVLAGGVAHDFSNLLTPILGEASLALVDLPEDSPVRKRLERIAHSARRASGLTKQMLAYAGADVVEAEILELSALMKEAPLLVESLVLSRTSIDYELLQGLSPVDGNSAQLLQVAMNLVSNAAEALEGEPGTISIRTGAMDLRDGAPHEFSYGSLESGEYVYLEVEDTGCGMNSDTRGRIFDPFFTTKFTGRGLGLAAVLGIVRAHGGALELESESGQGTRFRVILPVSGKERKSAGAPPRRLKVAPSLAGTVLLIDDDEAVVDIASETLRRVGFEVVGCTDASEGIEVFRKRSEEIGLVLLDRAMPGVSGSDAIRALREIRKEVVVLLISGYSESRVTTEFAGQGIAGFLQKPFMPEGLIKKVRGLLL